MMILDKGEAVQRLDWLGFFVVGVPSPEGNLA
jgi:hypothetical protein